MNKLSKLVLVTCLCGFFQTLPVHACRFNVREVGFVDLGIEPYHLFCYIDQETSADIVSSLKEISYAALMGSNVESEIIDIDQQDGHPAMKYLDSRSVQSLPAAVLVSPDGQSLPVPITKPNRPFKKTLSSALDSILSSSKRKEILQQVSKTYGVVLLIEGADAQENNRAKQAASAAIEQVSSQMEMLPKPISHPPVLVLIEQKSLSQEKILLWSLGLNAGEISKPHAAVLYGRARWLGPMFVGEQITETNLAAILLVIGADCECGLDQRWLQGTMLPAKWDGKLLALVAETLEFDPENPMVKMEISGIVRRGYSYYPSLSIDYRELAVDSAPVDEAQQAPAVQAPNDTSSSAVSLVSEQSILAEDDSPFKKPLYFIVGLTVLIIAGGLLIVLRRARRNL